MSKPVKYLAGQTAFIVGKPGVEFGKPVTYRGQVVGCDLHAVSIGPVTIAVEPVYLTPKILDIA